MIKVKSSTEQKNEGGSPRALFFYSFISLPQHGVCARRSNMLPRLHCERLHADLQPVAATGETPPLVRTLDPPLVEKPLLCFLCCLCTAGSVSILEALQRASVQMRSLRASGFQLCSLCRHLARERHRLGGVGGGKPQLKKKERKDFNTQTT